MYIILDTTETYDNLRLDTPDFKLLQSFLRKKPAVLIVPRIVVQETVNHYRERLMATLSSAGEKLRQLHHLLSSSPEIKLSEIKLPEIDFELAIDRYEEEIEKQLKRLHAKELNYEDIGLATIVERALRRRKPFDAKGRAGFRDTLLWETVLQELQQNPGQAVIITTNTNDFGVHGSLAQHLCDDLKTIGQGVDSVTVCAGLGKFVEEYVKPHLEKLNEIQQQINNGDYNGFNMGEFYRAFLSDIRGELIYHVKRYNLDCIARSCNGEFREPRLVELFDTIHSNDANDVWNVNEKEIAVGICYYVSGEIECIHEICVEPYGRRREEPFVGGVLFTLYMTIILARDSGDIVTWELDDVEIETDGWRDKKHSFREDDFNEYYLDLFGES
jgi:hypothetical protein